MNGVTPNAISDIFQEYMNPMVKPASKAEYPSTWGPRDSVLTPLMIVLSCAIADVSTELPFSR